jgi:hypothetical protein
VQRRVGRRDQHLERRKSGSREPKPNRARYFETKAPACVSAHGVGATDCNNRYSCDWLIAHCAAHFSADIGSDKKREGQLQEQIVLRREVSDGKLTVTPSAESW